MCFDCEPANQLHMQNNTTFDLFDIPPCCASVLKSSSLLHMARSRSSNKSKKKSRTTLLLQANPWRAQVLSDAPKEEGEGERPFYRLCHFRARPEQPLLPLDRGLWLSDNFFRPTWVGLGERRLKTASVLLEWHPEISQARQKRGMQLRVRRFFEEMQRSGVPPTEAAMKALGKAKDSLQSEPLTTEELAGDDATSSVTSPRYLVLVTLAEAETLRWLARSAAKTDVGFALRSLAGRQLEASAGFIASDQNLERQLSLVRLFNCEMFFGEMELQLLEEELKEVPLHLRQSWFEELLRLRRRRARFLWLDTPLAKLFTPQDILDLAAVGGREKCKAKSKCGKMWGLSENALQGPMSPDALRQKLLKLRLGFSAADVQDAVNMLPVSGDMVEVDDALQVQQALVAQRERRGLKAAKDAQAAAEHLEKAQRVPDGRFGELEMWRFVVEFVLIWPAWHSEICCWAAENAETREA
eukprot:s8_g31.t1